jgi:uncharacterized membrane protein
MRLFLSVILIAAHGYFLVSDIESGDYTWAIVHAICILIHYASIYYRINVLDDESNG